MDRPKCPKCIEYEWPDPQEPVEGGEFCVFHAPAGSKKIRASDFNTLVLKRISSTIEEQGSICNQQRCILSGTIFPSDISFVKLRKNKLPPIDFSSSTFEGKANFSFLSLHKVTTFNQIIFNDEVDFTSVVFGHDKSGDSYESVGFSKTEFMCSASFNNAQFNAKIYFLDSIFADTADFSICNVNNSVLFSRVIFGGESNFTRLFVDKDVLFYSIKFFEEASFAFLHGRSNSVSIINTDIDSIYNMFFSSIEADVLYFKFCCWPERLLIEKDHKKNLLVSEELYRSLKQKASSEHNQPMVSRWHYREKLMVLKQLKEKRGWLHLASITWLYYTFSGFGEEPKRAWWWLFGVIFLPLVVLAVVAVFETTPEFVFNSKRAAQVVTDWLRFIPFIKQEPATTDGSLLGALYLFWSSAWQILIALQAALFGFALRNKFRR